MSYTLPSWRDTAATGVVESVPLKDYESALVLVENYLSAVGGWIPEDVNDPQGLGMPANQAEPGAAVDTITGEQQDRIRVVSLEPTIKVRLDYVANLPADQDDESIIGTLETAFEDFLEQQLANSNISLMEVQQSEGTVEAGGFTSTAERLSIHQQAIGNQDITDPRAVAVNFARTFYGLSDNWNAYNCFTELDRPIVVMIRQYTNSTFQTLDPDQENQYILQLKPNVYKVLSGLKSPIED